MNGRRRGFTLLEVILSLAILAGAMVTLGELVRYGRWNAEAARDLTRAELLCESKLAEITAGIAAAEAVSNASLEDEAGAWLYSVDVETLDQQGLISVKVTVRRDLPNEKHPAEFSLVRWVPDPGYELPAEETAASDAAGSTDASGGTTGAAQ